MNIFKRLRAALRLSEAVRQADKQHLADGHRYYVMPNGTTGKLLIMDRENFRILKSKHYISQRARVKDLEKECFYCTPYENGNDMLTDWVIKMKRREYMRYVVGCDAMRREERKAERHKR